MATLGLRAAAHPIVWLAGLLAVFFAPEVFGGRVFSPADLLFQWAPWKTVAPSTFVAPSNGLRSDEAFIYLPRRLQTARDLLAHGPSLWQAHTLVGGPVTLTLDQLGCFLYPPMLAFLVTGPGVANTVLHVSVPLLAGLCMYPLTGRLTSRPLLRFVGVAAWSLNGYLVVWLSAVQLSVIVAILPLLVLLGVKVLERAGGAALFGYGALLAWTFFSGYPPGNIVLCGLLGVGFAAAFVAAERRSWSGAGWLLVGTVLGLGVATFAISAMAHEVLGVAGSQFRGPIVPLPLKDLQTFVLPNALGNPLQGDWAVTDPSANYCEWVAYAGIVLLAPAAVGAVGAWTGAARGRALVLAALAIGVVAALLAYAVGPTAFVDRLPLLREVRPARWQIGIVFAIVVCGVSGLDLVFDRRARPRVLLASCAGVALLAAVVVLRRAPDLLGGDRFLLHDHALRLGLLGASLAVLGGVALRRTRGLRWGRVALPVRSGLEAAIVLLVVVDMVSFGKDFNPAVAPSAFYPSTPAIRYLAAHAGKTPVLAYDKDGGLFPGDTLNVYGIESLTGYDHLRQEGLIRLLGANVTPSQRDFWARNGYLMLGGPSFDLDAHVFDELGVRYAYEVSAGTGAPARAWQHWTAVYRGPDGTIYRNLDALPGRFLVDGGSAIPLPGTSPGSGADQVAVRGEGTLVWSKPLDPGFTVRVDGRPAAPTAYDGYLLGVRVGPGSHVVSVAYQPPGYALAGSISVASLLVLAALSVWLVVLRHRRRARER